MNHNDTGHEQPGKSLSFQDITAELGDIRMPPPETEAAGKVAEPAETPSYSGGTIIVEDTGKSPFPKEAIATSVLTGSSPKPRPMWIDGFVCDALAAVFIMPVIVSAGLRGYQPWISYCVMFLARGFSWSLFGMQVENGRRAEECV